MIRIERFERKKNLTVFTKESVRKAETTLVGLLITSTISGQEVVSSGCLWDIGATDNPKAVSHGVWVTCSPESAEHGLHGLEEVHGSSLESAEESPHVAHVEHVELGSGALK